MENKCKRFLSLLLALVMVIGLMPVGHVHAEEAEASANLALGKAARVSDWESHTEFTADKAVDGDLSTRWATNQSLDGEDRSILVDLDSEQAIKRFEIHFERSDAEQNIKAYEVKVSTDEDVWNNPDQNSPGWETVYTYDKEAMAAQHETIVLEEIKTARYVMLTVTDYDGGTKDYPNVSVCEFEVYGPDYVMEVGETATIEVEGDYSGLNGTGNDAVSVGAVFTPELTEYTVDNVTTDATLETGKYILQNTRVNKFLESTSANNKLWLTAKAIDIAETWTITKVDGGYTMQASNGQYLTFDGSSSSLTDTETVLSFTWKDTSTWQIGCGGQYLNSYDSEQKVAGWWQDGDGGSQWKLYKLPKQQAYTWTLGEAVSQIEDGGYYIFENNQASSRAANLVSSKWSDTGNGGGGTGYGLLMENNKTNFGEQDIWKITGTAGNYHVQAYRGWNLFIASGKATLTPESHTTVIGQDSGSYAGKWQISVGGVHLNWWGGANGTGVQVAGWNNVNDSNSQWNIYEVIPTAAGSTTITFTALQAGTAEITVGDTTYIIYVQDDAHTHEYESVVTAPTCTEGGYTTYTCTICGDSYTADEVAALGHTEEVITGKPATCTETGLTDGVKCSVCGEIITAQEEIPALGHTAAEAVIENNVDPTCTEAGSYDNVVYCTVCDAEISRENVTVPAAGHKDENNDFVCDVCDEDLCTEHVEETVKGYAATCTEPGLTDGVRCAICGEILTPQEEIPALGHDYEGVITAPTCAAGGYTTFTCTRCADTYVGDETEELGHDYEAVVTAPTCTENGHTTYTCSRCGDSYNEVIPATGHQNTVTTPAVLPTLKAPGRTEEVYCNDCQQVISGGEEIPALTAKNAKILNSTGNVVALADCEYVLGGAANGPYSLSHAGTYYVKPCATTSTIPQTLGEFSQLTLTWQANGSVWIGSTLANNVIGGGSIHIWTAGKDVPYWDRCGSGHGFNASNGTHDLYLFRADEDSTNTAIPGYTQVTSADMQIGESYLIAAKKGDSDWYIMVPAATDEKFDHIAQIAADAITHTHTYTTTIQAATCTATGLKTDACDCGHKHIEVLPVDENAHTPGEAVEENRVSATCTTDGSYDSVVYCSACNEELSCETVTVPATGHTPGEVARENEVVPTCTEAGSYDLVVRCTVCGAETSRETVTVDALGHTYEAVVTAPTCTKGGYTTYTCSRCGDSYTADETEALGHTEEVIPGKAATCTEPGLTDGVKCSVCGEIIVAQEEIPALGHTGAEPVVENNVAPTCTTAGSYDKVTYCTVCDAEISRETVTVDALGHTEEIIPGKDATCTESGLTAGKKCSACGEIIVAQEEIPALGHTAAEAVIENNVAPTCTEAGSYDKVTYCSVCGVEVSRETVTVPAAGHKDENNDFVCDVCDEDLCTNHVEEIVKGYAATCTEPGLTDGVRCANCGEVIVAQEEIPALGHTEEVVPGKAATCTETGLTDGVKCSVCGEVIVAQEEISALGHTGAEPVVENNVAPTCTTAGSYDNVVYCTVCGEVISRETVTVDALGHTEETIPGKAATCTETGLTDGVKCSVCGEIIVAQEEIPALGHTAAEAVIENNVAPTCTEAGSYDKVTYCSVCGVEVSRETITVPAAGHKDEDNDFICDVCSEDLCTNHVEEIVKGYAATCTEPGLTEGVKCSVCGEIIVAQVEIPALGHTEEVIPGKAATCTETGLTEGKKCSVCGEILVAQEEIPALGHTEEVVPGKAATCTESGLTEGKKCSVCGETLVAQEEIPALGHTEEVIPGKAATCTEAGLTDGVKCSVCGEVITAQEEIPALGHTEEVIPGKAATCTETGLTDGVKCSVCGEIITAQEEIPALGHTEEVIPGKAATCTETGLTEGKKCSVCGETLVAQEEIPALGHTEEVVPGKAATCTETGLTEGKKCSVCGEIITAQEEIPALGHTEEVVPGKAATCTEAGLTDGVKCSVCGEIITAQEEIPALGHTEEAIPGKAATCTETGLTEGKKCSVCGETLVAQEEIPALGHTEEVVPGKAATCTETGLTDGVKCSVCGEIITAQEEIPALGHDWHGTGCSRCDATRENPFVDVPGDEFYIDPVLWALDRGITTGTTPTTFSPYRTVTRAEAVTFLWRALGSPEPISGINPFLDVNEGDFFYKAVLWAYENGVTTGVSPIFFAPFQECSRAQIVTFLWRAVGKPESHIEVTFTDVQPGEFYYDAVAWALENGITTGMGGGTFGVLMPCNRAQVVTFLYRTLA